MLRPASLLVCMCVSCGALDPPAPALRPLSDGISPWTAPTPLDLCIGGARLLAPSRDPGAAGFCDSSARTPCAADEACGARERCVCGRCALALCRSDHDCSSGSVCVPDEHRCVRACVTSADCPGSGQCRAGACQFRCESAGDCARGELCDALGRCLAQPCRADAECAGQTCDRQALTGSLRHPSVLIDGARAVLFVELRGEGIIRAVSLDGQRFRAEPANVLLGPGFGAPSAVKFAGRWVMALETPERYIAISTSADGLGFSAPSVLLRPEQHWESGALGAPSLCEDAGGLLLAYSASLAIGMARITPADDGGFVATRVHDRASANSRVLDPERVLDPVLWRAVNALEAPYLVRENSERASLRMFFSARGAESSATSARGVLIDPVIHWSVGVAVVSADGTLHPSGTNPVLSRGSGLSVAADARDPAVFSLNERWRMVLRGTDIAGTDEGLFTALGR